MAGNTVGSVNHYITASAPNANQNAFKIMYDFFNTTMVGAGYATRVALQYGISGTGTDFHDDASPFGEGAFAVFRMNGVSSGNTDSIRNDGYLADFDYYVLIQWRDSTNWNTGTTGNGGGALIPGILNNSNSGDGVGVAVAARLDGYSPWNGTTNNDGTDSKGDPVWTNGSSITLVLPRSNNSGTFSTDGTHQTQRHNFARASEDLTGTSRVHCLGNADSFLILSDNGDSGGYFATFVGIISLRNGVTYDRPLIMFSSNLPFSEEFNYGGTVGNAAQEGGMMDPSFTGVSSVMLGMDVSGIFRSDTQANGQITPNELDQFPIRINSRAPDRIGYAGDADSSFIQIVYHNVSQETNSAGNRAYMGNGGAGYIFRISVPWSNTAAAPGTGTSRAGTQF